MFDSKTSLSDRFADSLDLAIDFATLGEYGLEPTGAHPRAPHPCSGDRRTVRPSAPKRRKRGPRTSTGTISPGQSDLWSQMTSHPSREGAGRNPRLAKAKSDGPGREEMRVRGVRVASGKPTGRGTAWQRHASRGSVA
jgi:hypothetical protein